MARSRVFYVLRSNCFCWSSITDNYNDFLKFWMIFFLIFWPIACFTLGVSCSDLTERLWGPIYIYVTYLTHPRVWPPKPQGFPYMDLKQMATKWQSLCQRSKTHTSLTDPGGCIWGHIPMHASFAVLLPVLSRLSFTSKTPDKDQKIEQLFYFLLVQVQ